ncbi:MAG: hypothetical protein M3O91_08105 [Chloroflexota bacterium]|nr:hypothetical protein [Chloroflexota bacterium]
MIRPLGLAARLVAPSTLTRWLFAVGKAMILFIGALAAMGIIDGVSRTNPVVILVSWSLLSVAATVLFALSRAAGRR